MSKNYGAKKVRLFLHCFHTVFHIYFTLYSRFSQKQKKAAKIDGGSWSSGHFLYFILYL